MFVARVRDELGSGDVAMLILSASSRRRLLRAQTPVHLYQGANGGRPLAEAGTADDPHSSNGKGTHADAGRGTKIATNPLVAPL